MKVVLLADVKGVGKKGELINARHHREAGGIGDRSTVKA